MERRMLHKKLLLEAHHKLLEFAPSQLMKPNKVLKKVNMK